MRQKALDRFWKVSVLVKRTEYNLPGPLLIFMFQTFFLLFLSFSSLPMSPLSPSYLFTSYIALGSAFGMIMSTGVFFHLYMIYEKLCVLYIDVSWAGWGNLLFPQSHP